MQISLLNANELDEPGNELNKFVTAGDINLFLSKNYSEEIMDSASLESLYDKLKLNSRQKYFGVKLNSTQLIQSSNEPTVSPFNFYLMPDNSVHISGEKIITSFVSSYSMNENNYEETLQHFSSFYKNAEENNETVLINFIDQTIWGSKSIKDDLFFINYRISKKPKCLDNYLFRFN